MWNYANDVLRRIASENDPDEDELVECRGCGAEGLEERIENHDCRVFQSEVA